MMTWPCRHSRARRQWLWPCHLNQSKATNWSKQLSRRCSRQTSTCNRSIKPLKVFCFDKPVDYVHAWHWQRDFRERRIKQKLDTDVLLLLEHPHVFTLGRGASDDNLLFDPAHSSIPVHRVERGGEVTYHGPGQLVGYPILDLHHFKLDLHWYLRMLEETIIKMLMGFGITGRRVEGLTGVWHEQHKLAAVGVSASKWITTHGFSVNANPSLDHFEMIVPCGIKHKRVGSIAQVNAAAPKSASDLYSSATREFDAAFGTRSSVVHVSDLHHVNSLLSLQTVG